jgi:hypothetical protein
MTRDLLIIIVYLSALGAAVIGMTLYVAPKPLDAVTSIVLVTLFCAVFGIAPFTGTPQRAVEPQPVHVIVVDDGIDMSFYADEYNNGLYFT